jgi:hypothetical protein
MRHTARLNIIHLVALVLLLFYIPNQHAPPWACLSCSSTTKAASQSMRHIRCRSAITLSTPMQTHPTIVNNT